MIFVTVGAQMPFDRLVDAVDRWAASQSQVEVCAQIGSTELRPKHLAWVPFLTPVDFRRRCAEATAIVSHAGVGSILTALELGRPILVMPRRADMLETRNDHHFASAERFAALGSVAAAYDENELVLKLNQLQNLASPDPISRDASPLLIERIRCFIGQSG